MQLPLQLDDVTPAEPYRPAGHWPLQLALVSPLMLPYRPAAQATHDPVPDNEYWPAGHNDAVEFVDPAGHAYPALQLPLQLEVVRTELEPKLPAAHKLHEPDPDDDH